MVILLGRYLSTNVKKGCSHVASKLLHQALVHTNLRLPFLDPPLIQLANDLEVNPGPSYLVDCYKTVSADFHQGNVSLFGRNSGKQCVAMCFTAVIYKCKTSASTWSTENLNEYCYLVIHLI